MGREILDLVDEQEVWVDIDAPLRVPPGRTSRRCEREVCAQGIRILPSERGSTSAITGATGVRCYRRSWSGRDCDTSIAGSVHTLIYARTVIHAISPQPARYKRILAASRKR
jgi:hypothetical protein